MRWNAVAQRWEGASLADKAPSYGKDRILRGRPAGGKVVGLISIGDLVQAIISDQRDEIEQLGNYISG